MKDFEKLKLMTDKLPMTKIAGTGSYVPSKQIENAEIASRLGIDEHYIFKMTGIRTRYWANDYEDCSFLAEQAARQAIESAGMEPNEIDAIVVSTTSPDKIFPSTACLVQQRLGLRHAAAFDVSASCSGFLYGLSMADCFIRSNQFRHCLVVAAEVKSRYLNLSDIGTSILFGDGAGAAIVCKGNEQKTGILKVRLFSDGGYPDLVAIPAGGSRLSSSQETVLKGLHTIQLRGSTLFRVAVKRLSASILELFDEENVTGREVHQVIFHQANLRMLHKLVDRLGVSRDRLFSVIDRFGNTSSASLPMALDCANRQGCLNPGDLILLGTFGGGLTWSTALVRWG